MKAAVQDFLGGLLRDCEDLLSDWRRRHGTDHDWRLTRLASWEMLGRALPDNPNDPTGPRLDVDRSQLRLMWDESKGLAFLEHQGRVAGSTDLPTLVDQLYRVLAADYDPPGPYADDRAKEQIIAWGQAHLDGHVANGADLGTGSISLPQAAMAMLDFLGRFPDIPHVEQIAALLASALPFWAGAPMVHVLPPHSRVEEGFFHAMESAMDGEEGAWIAYYLSKARRQIKRMGPLLMNSEPIRRRWVSVLRRAPFEEKGATCDSMAAQLIALPVITPSFVRDCRVSTTDLRNAMVLMFAADEAVDIDLPGQGLTLLPAPLRLLTQ